MEGSTWRRRRTESTRGSEFSKPKKSVFCSPGSNAHLTGLFASVIIMQLCALIDRTASDCMRSLGGPTGRLGSARTIRKLFLPNLLLSEGELALSSTYVFTTTMNRYKKSASSSLNPKNSSSRRRSSKPPPFGFRSYLIDSFHRYHASIVAIECDLPNEFSLRISSVPFPESQRKNDEKNFFEVNASACRAGFPPRVQRTFRPECARPPHFVLPVVLGLLGLVQLVPHPYPLGNPKFAHWKRIRSLA